MFQFSTRPLFWILVFIIPGLILGSVLEPALPVPFQLAVGAVLLFLCNVVRGRTSQSLAISFLIVYFGFLMTSGYGRLEDIKFATGIEEFLLVHSIKEKQGKKQLIASFYKDGVNIRSLIQYRDSCELNILPGHVIRVNSNLFEPSGARSPGGFNYKNYLYRNGIRLVSYPKCGQIQIIDSSRLDLSGIQWHLSQKVLSRIDQVFTSDKSNSLVKGILLGHKAEMQKFDVQKYSYAGISHVFAVSGMHVGMIYLFFMPLLIFRYYNNWSRVFLPLFVLTGVWLFIFVSGMSPSAVRAGIMISLYEVGKMAYRNIDKWNILAASALIGIVIDPNIIFDIGFQFSYLALSGIFLFYTPLSRLCTSKIIPLKWIWNGIVLSVAAQLSLLPLSLHYFGNFSPYFWINSLIAMVTVQVNFILAIFCLILPLHSVLADSLVAIVNYLFALLDSIIDEVMTWQYAELHTGMTFKMVILFYCMAMLVVIYWKSNNRRIAFKYCLVLSIVLLLVESGVRVSGSGGFISIYQPGNPTIQISRGDNVKSFEIESSKIYSIGEQQIQLYSDQNLVDDGTTILLLNNDVPDESYIEGNFCLKYIISGGDTPWKYRKILHEFCSDYGLIYHDLSRELIKINL